MVSNERKPTPAEEFKRPVQDLLGSVAQLIDGWRGSIAPLYPLAESYREFVELLEDAMEHLSVEFSIDNIRPLAEELGDLGWVMPMSSRPNDIKLLLKIANGSTETLDEEFLVYLHERGEPDRLLRKLARQSYLSPWKVLLDQTREAIERQHHAIAVAGSIQILHGFIVENWDSSNKQKFVNPKNLIAELRKQHGGNPRLVAMLLISAEYFVRRFFSAQVGHHNREPSVPNRNLIVRGLDKTDQRSEADVLRILVAIEVLVEIRDMTNRHPT